MKTIEEIISSLNKEQMQFVLTKLAENDNYNQDIIRKYSTGKIISYDYLQTSFLKFLILILNQSFIILPSMKKMKEFIRAIELMKLFKI